VRTRSPLGGVAAGLALGLLVLLGAWVRARPGVVEAIAPWTGRPRDLVRAPAGVAAPAATEAASASTASREASTDLETLRGRNLALPLPDLDPRLLRDSFYDPRGGRSHEALDIPAPRGTRVVAVEDGVVAKLFNSARGGLTVYHFDPSATYCYYYAHLDAYAPGLREGLALRRGDLVGYVGTTGNAPPQTPHLHFAIFRLGTPPRWWEGTPINPYPVWVRPGRPEGTPVASE
jgi:murein DD-endopeptidase MepM/ murein hydrolase activator NlpD